MIERILSELPDLSDPYPLGEEHIEFYRTNGYVVLPAVVSREEMPHYRRVIRDSVARKVRDSSALSERDTYGRAFQLTTNLWEADELARKFVFSRRFAQIAAELMGVGGVRLYHDQALFDDAAEGRTPWHQDHYYWPLDTANMITMWMPIVPMTPQMGTLQFAAGSHSRGTLGSVGISEESDEKFRELVEAEGMEVTDPLSLEPGDAVYYSGWVLHSAKENETETHREGIKIIYFEDGARILQPDNFHQMAAVERWFPGGKAGEVAASNLNPVLYTRT